MPIYCKAFHREIILRIPINNKICAHASNLDKLGYGKCNKDYSRRNVFECGTKCYRFKPKFLERVRMAWYILTWKGVRY